MDLYEALYTTRAMRRVKPDPIPQQVVRLMMDAAVQSVGWQRPELALRDGHRARDDDSPR
jgi:hypothetical protein